ADDRLLDLAGAVLMHFQPRIHRGDNGCAPGLTQLERRIRIACHEHLLDAEHLRPVLADEFTQAVEDLLQPIGEGTAAQADATGRHVFAAIAPFPDDTETGDSRTRIYAENQRHACNRPVPDRRKGGRASLSVRAATIPLTPSAPVHRRGCRRWSRRSARRPGLPACRSAG